MKSFYLFLHKQTQDRSEIKTVVWNFRCATMQRQYSVCKSNLKYDFQDVLKMYFDAFYLVLLTSVGLKIIFMVFSSSSESKHTDNWLWRLCV